VVVTMVVTTVVVDAIALSGLAAALGKRRKAETSRWGIAEFAAAATRNVEDAMASYQTDVMAFCPDRLRR
jgi:hypothetical protein